MDETEKSASIGRAASRKDAPTDNESPETSHPLAQRCDVLLNLIEQAANGDSNLGDLSTNISHTMLFDEDLHTSFDELRRLNDTLQESIHFRESLQCNLQLVVDEREDIDRRLHGCEQDVDTTRETILENARLYQALDSVTHNIELQRSSSVTHTMELQRSSSATLPNPSSDQLLPRPTLATLLRHLIERRLQNPTDPYIDPTLQPNANPNDVQLLLEAGVVEVFQDTELICLTDYSADLDLDQSVA
jgi:hypothetical protein